MPFASPRSVSPRSRERSEAIRLLEDLRSNRTGLSVFSRALGGRFTSLVLEVQAEKSCLVLDELVPSHGHDGMQPGVRLTAEGRLDGVLVSFECEVLDVGEDRKGFFYSVTLPALVKRLQRRQHHRVPAAARALRALLREADDLPPVDGEIVDVSTAGIAVRVGKPDADRLVHAARELDCHLTLGPDDSLDVTLEVCRVIDQGGGQTRVLAGRLRNLTPAIERRIGLLVSELERELVRKRPPDQGKR